MKRILVTSFEPFGDMKLNSSSLVMGELKSHYRGIILLCVLLPVVYKEAFEILLSKIESFDPDFVVCMGQAGGRNNISIEKAAININSASVPDNKGIVKTDEFIINNGPAAYFTNLPYKKMLEHGGENISISYSAGTYICNDTFYRLMHYISSSDKKIKGGFMHLPYTEHFGKMPYMDLAAQLKTVEAIIAVMGE